MNEIIRFLTAALAVVLTLSACGGETAANSAEAEVVGAQSKTLNAAPAAVSAVLSTEFDNALPVEAQLAYGTMQLENTSHEITAEQAGVILPYWRALQSLRQTGTAADVELNAVVKQIEDRMTADQIASIAAMELTEEKVETMIEEGAIALGSRLGSGGAGDASSGSARPGGGPGGGLLGSGPGPGGFGGDPEAMLTRQAEMEESGEASLSAVSQQMATNRVIRLLENKTGEAPAGVFPGLRAAYTVVSELTGLSAEELNAALAEGKTLGDVLETHGVSLEEAAGAIMEELAGAPLPPAGQDLEGWVLGLLSG